MTNCLSRCCGVKDVSRYAFETVAPHPKQSAASDVAWSDWTESLEGAVRAGHRLMELRVWLTPASAGATGANADAKLQVSAFQSVYCDAKRASVIESPVRGTAPVDLAPRILSIEPGINVTRK